MRRFSRGGFGGFGGFGMGGMGYDAFDMSGPRGSLLMAELVVRLLDEGKHDQAVALASAVRDSLISMAVAMALVTEIQDPKNPVIVTDPDFDPEFNEAEPKTPEDLLHTLCGSLPEEEWNRVVNLFKEKVNANREEKILSEIPKEFTVADILGENKDEENG